MLYCSNCGHQLDDKDVYCDKCGTATINEPDINIETNLKDISFSAVEEDKKQTVKIGVIVIIFGLILSICFLIFTGISDNERVEENNSRIESVKNSHFEFLPEINVGDLIYEYYGEDYWICNASTGYVEFFGDNKKDNSGISLQFYFTGTKGIVDVSTVKYHKENEEAHDISKEEFEEYFLSLYNTLSDDNKNVTTTDDSNINVSITSETEKVTTIASETTNVQNIITSEFSSDYYTLYLEILDYLDTEIKREYGNNTLTYRQYYIYDINKDGIYEILIHMGAGEADTLIGIYSLDENGELLELTHLGGGHTWLSEKDGKLYSNFGYKGIQKVVEIRMLEDLGSWIIFTDTIYEEYDLLDYTTYGTALQWYDISDKSAVYSLLGLVENFDDSITGIVTTDGDELFVRSAPEIVNSPGKGNKIDCFPNGTRLEIDIDNSTDEWYYVTGKGLSGNIVSGYVSKNFVVLE